VGLFNIMQEGDVQIKGYPVRLPLECDARNLPPIRRLHSARQIITPLKDRIGARFARITRWRFQRHGDHQTRSLDEAGVRRWN